MPKSKQRTVRTPAERLAAAKAEAVRVEQQVFKQAEGLIEQARGWKVRASELDVKAHGALTKAWTTVDEIGADPVEFFEGFGIALDEDGVFIAFEQPED